MIVRGPLFVGVDGGGTRTRLNVIDLDGKTVYADEGPATNVATLGAEEVVVRLTAMLSDMKRRSPQIFSAIEAFAFGLAGIENTSEVPGQCVLKALTEFLHGRFVRVVNDGYVAWYAGHRGDPGITIVSGTGSTCVGVDNNSQIITTGGMGSLLADNGSGYEIGLRGIRSAIRAYNGIGPDTILCDAVRKAFSLSALGEAPKKIRDRAEISAFALNVYKASLDADNVSVSIIRSAATDLSALVRSVCRSGSFSDSDVRVTTAGGCLDNMHALFSAFVQNLTDSPGRFSVYKSTKTPQQAAAELAHNAYEKEVA